MSVPSFDQLLARLAQADIRFVVIGGLALGSWGVIRGTKDCDIVPDPAPENLDKLARLVVPAISSTSTISTRLSRLPIEACHELEPRPQEG